MDVKGLATALKQRMLSRLPPEVRRAAEVKLDEKFDRLKAGPHRASPYGVTGESITLTVEG